MPAGTNAGYSIGSLLYHIRSMHTVLDFKTPDRGGLLFEVVWTPAISKLCTLGLGITEFVECRHQFECARSKFHIFTHAICKFLQIYAMTVFHTPAPLYFAHAYCVYGLKYHNIHRPGTPTKRNDQYDTIAHGRE